jgi:SAM-dependent MidA family methyltransferase
MLTGDQALSDFIRSTIRAQGPVAFDWFMEQALYHPQLGFYSSGRAEIGRRGDYFTNVSVGPLFGRMMAAQFAEMWELLGRAAGFTLVEQGADSGDFACDVLRSVREGAPDFFEALRYCIVEPFPVLEARQRDRLGEFGEKVSWRKSLGELEPFTGVHFSNELLDAMPVRLIGRAEGTEWQERLVGISGEGFEFVRAPVPDGELRARVEKIPQHAVAPYETEINLTALDWIEAVSKKLERGFVLAADYGYPRDDFYSPARTTGTLQCYSKHRRVSSPLVDAGSIDISASVEWTSIAERGEQAGLTLIGFTDQHHFMTGMLNVVIPAESERRALQTLMHPEFLGTRFQYLALGKDLPDAPLSGFRFARDPRGGLGQVARALRRSMTGVPAKPGL